MDAYLIKGFAMPGRHSLDIFEVFKNIINKHSVLQDVYWEAISAKRIRLESVEDFLAKNHLNRENPCDPFGLYVMDKNTYRKDQGVSYFPRTGEFVMVFREDLLDSPDLLLCDWIARVPISNAICSLMNYAISFQAQWFKPPNSNLFHGLGLSNDRNGYIEGVSAEMWFGDSFWQHAKCTKADVLKQHWLHCEERPAHLYVRAWPEPFSSAEGEQGEIQRRLLDLLFGINGKTPPPHPAPPQSTFVQKVLVDGDKVRDLGMEEVRPDGSPSQITPPEPPMLP